jgi:HlyD family secretion protein
LGPSEILVREGDKVIGPEEKPETATVLARLDDRDIQARLRQASFQVKATDRALDAAKSRLGAARSKVEAAKAHVTQTVSDYLRYEDLYKSKAATGQQLEHARAQRDMAEAQMRASQQEVEATQDEILRLQAQKEQSEASVTEAQVMLSYTLIRAPFTGQVIRKTVEVGDTVSPGQTLFLLDTPLHPELHAVVAESLLPHLQVGQQLEVHVDALDETLWGKVREIVPQADPATRTVSVKVSLPPQPELVSGLFGRLRIPYGQYETLVIPAAAVRKVGQLDLVDVADAQGHRHRRFVTLGHHHDALVEVLSGLEEGDEVVIP